MHMESNTTRDICGIEDAVTLEDRFALVAAASTGSRTHPSTGSRTHPWLYSATHFVGSRGLPSQTHILTGSTARLSLPHQPRANTLVVVNVIFIRRYARRWAASVARWSRAERGARTD